MQSHTAQQAGSVSSFLPGYQPLCWLWESEGALFPSEHSARWQVSRLRKQLNQAAALAKHRGHLFVHVEAFNKVLLEDSLRRAGSPTRGGT